MSTPHCPGLDAPLFLEPVLRPQVWGGRRLETILQKSLPDAGPFGEAWELSPLAQRLSRVAEGPAAGLTIDALWHGGLAENAGLPDADRFPWLIKWLDISDRLSVQVHPNDEQVRTLLGEPCGKSEAWVVVHAEPTARVYAGFHAGVTAADVRQRIARGDLLECLHSFTPHVGDCINIPAGTVHAAGGGLVIAEVQQPSDATFRLFDWNRLGTDGRPRTLHIDQALECLAWPQKPVAPEKPSPLALEGAENTAERLLTTPYFVFDRFYLRQPWCDGAEQMAAWMVLDAAALLEWSGGSRMLSRGETVLVPGAVCDLRWRPAKGSPVSLLRVRLPQPS